MSGLKLKRPKAATCEDWDEDTQSPLPGSKTTANVAVKRAAFQPDSPARPLKNSHEGSDSGYSSSKAPTDSSMSSHRRIPSDLPKVDTAVAERERKPYAYPAASAQPTRSASVRVKGKDTKSESQTSKTTKFVHKKGECWTCDEFGYHIKSEDLPRTTDAPTPSSPKAVRTSTPKAKDEPKVRPAARRVSSNRERPVSWFGPAPVQQVTSVPYTPLPVIYGSPIYEPTTPSFAYQYQPHPMTPMSPYAYEPVYFDHATPTVEYQQPSLQRRRSSRAREQSLYEQRPVKPSRMVETVSKERSSTVVSHKPTKSQEDRMMMPPPPKPSIDNISQSRPRPDRSQTYHTNRRSSQYLEDEDIPDLSNLSLKDDRPPSPRRAPPSSFRAPANSEAVDRPRVPGKSRSYTQGSATAEVAAARKQALPRRTTMNSIPMEQKEADAEEYQRQKGSLMANDLTAENLRRVPRHTVQRSEAGSATSRMSHHSSSKGSSSGRGRASKTNINVNGVIVSIPEDYPEQLPLKIDLGGVTISAGAKDKETYDTVRELKRIERAPSTSSRTSRRSVAGASGYSSNIIRKDRDDHYRNDNSRESSRRPSQLEEDPRDGMRGSGKSSRQHSRTGSSGRGSFDIGRNVRYSQDYDTHQDYAVYGA